MTESMYSILLVDSVSSYRKQVSWHLEQLGFKVSESQDGKAAIEALKAEPYDIVIIDNDLISKSGLDLVPLIRKVDEKAAIVIIVDPFFVEEDHRPFLRDHRVTRTLRGPLSPAALAQQIRDVTFSGGVKVQRQAERREHPKTPEDHIKALRRTYQKKLPEELNNLGMALEAAIKETTRENLDRIHRLAHTLHGTSGTLGFEEVSDLTGRIDDQIKDLLAGEPPTAARWESILQVFQRAKTVPERLSLVISVEPHTNNIATILVADRDPAILENIALTAHNRCIDVRGATDGEQMLDAATGGVLDGAVIDLHFSRDRSIVEVMEALRSVEARKTLPIALMSKDASIANRVAAAHAGATHFLTKPPSSDELAEVVQHFVANNEQLTYRLLIIDDDEPFREHIAAILKEEGYNVTILEDPTRVLEVAEATKPDIILLDVIMPEISGFDITRMLRATTNWKEIPLLFLTAEASPKVRLECFRAGGDDYIKKPVLKEELLARIGVRLERTRLYKERADRDALTTLPTRRAFLEMFKVRIAEVLRYKRSACLCLIDIDRFKYVNDTYGHLTGDRVLATLGQLLGSRFRSVDIRGRWGGEEFTIVFYGEEKQTGKLILSRVLEEFRQIPFEGEHGERFNCSFSCGIAELPEDGTTSDALFRIADERLYKAKELGRCRIETE